MALFISMQTGDRVQTSPELSLFKIWKVWKLRGISQESRCLMCNVWDTFQAQSSSCTDQGGCSSQEKAKLCWAKMGFGTQGYWFCATVEIDRAHLWSVAAHRIMAWGDGENHLSWAPLSSGEREDIRVSSEQEAGFRSALKQEIRRLCFYTSLFLEQVKGQFRPHCSFGQYWEFPEITPYLS